MSSAVFTKKTQSPVLTRRPPAVNDDAGANSQRTTNRRSLSGKFRSLFRKNSSSPNRSTSNDGRLPSTSSRRRSPSPEPLRSSMEAPHLRAPTVMWPFGKKKTKTKDSKKNKQKSKQTTEISSPTYESEHHQTSIRGQNFVPRTPELVHGDTGRIQSSSGYDTTTKGFRDYMIIDQTRSPQQVVVYDVDAMTPPAYTPDHSRSPSINRYRLPDTNIEYSYHHDNSPSQHRHNMDDIQHSTTTQILAGKTPLLPQTSIPSPRVTQHPIVSTHSTPWQNTSYISLNNPSNENNARRPESQSHINGAYSSSSTVSNSVQPMRSWPSTYGSIPDAEVMHHGSASSLTPAKSNKYPWISAIVEHHMGPGSVYYNEYRSKTITSHRPQLFETSTTTFDDHNEQDQWSTTFNHELAPSPSSIHHHDGYIRPLTPQKSIQSDVHVIPIDLNKSHDQSPFDSTRSSHYNSLEPPTIYRSSTVIYTKDKHQPADGGEVLTWSSQENNNGNEDNQKEHKYEYERQRQQQYAYDTQKYSHNRYFSNINHDENSSFIPTTITERDKIYNQASRLYKDIEYTQEPFYTMAPMINSEVVPRHHTIKRTDSYNGLGITISADAQTHSHPRIRDVELASPGYRVGLRKNDRIIAVNGINVENVDFANVLILIKQGLDNNNLQLSVINESILM